MTETIQLDIPVLLPDLPDERDACLARLQALLGNRPDISKIHVLADHTPAKLCIHYDRDVISLSRVRELAEAAGARLTERFGHLVAVVAGTSPPRRAAAKARQVSRIAGVIEAEASGTGALRIEFDRKEISRDRLLAELSRLGLSLRRVLSKDETRPASSSKTRSETAVDETDHAHDADPDHDHGSSRLELAFALAAGFLVLAGWLLPRLVELPAPWIAHAPLWAAYFFGGFFTAREAIENIRSGRFQIDTLMLAAALGAALLGKWLEGGLLLFLFSLGHSLEHFAMAKARKAIESLGDLAPETATVVRRDSQEVVPVEQLRVGDLVRVKPDERVPADGFVVSGESAVNQAPVTGESVPVDKSPVDDVEIAQQRPEQVDAQHRVFAGTINGGGSLEIRVTKRSDDSTLARVVRMVTEAETMRSPTQRFTDKFERYFVPSVLALVVLLLFAFTVLDETFADSFYRAMAVLVAASPCALAIATPSAVLSGVAAAGNSGVLVKGGAPLENLGKLEAMAFDKTGTLTEGKPKVTTIHPFQDVESSELLSVAVAVESLSDHPLARAVVRHGKDTLGGMEHEAQDLKSVTGRGVRAHIGSEEVLVGKEELFDESEGPAIPEELHRTVEELEAAGQTTMIVRLGGRYLGVLGLQDTPREGARAMIAALRELGIRRMILISGDNQAVADAVGDAVGLDEAQGDLMPEDKVDYIKRLGEEGDVAMVGDGVNDAPAMANATVGIAMGAAGSDTALETAEIALMADDLSKLPYAVALSRKTSAIIRQNLWLSLGMVAFLIPATLMGMDIGPAVALHEGSTLVVVFNALRLLAFRDGSHSVP